MAKQEIKTIHGNDYLYLTYYDDETKKKKTIYCGPKSNGESKRNAIKHEIELVNKKIKNLQDYKMELKGKLG